MIAAPILYVTATNTGVGKTTLASLVLQHARERNLKIAALKPFCSGGREDGELLHTLQTAGMTLDEVNPFHFRDPITPLQAARNEKRAITLPQTLNAIEAARSRGFPLIIEGAGGLLSPLGEGFSLADLIENIPGKVAIVGTNALGVLNGILLTAHRLNIPQSEQSVVLMTPGAPDTSTSTNASLLNSLLPKTKVFEMPFQPNPRHARPVLDWWHVEF